MAIETPGVGRSLLYDALAQNDVDMANHRLLNLDTSNLPPIGIPPTVHPPANEWLHDWDAVLQEWTSTRPNFTQIAGILTLVQQRAITEVGVLRSGTWLATPLTAPYVPTLEAIRAPLGNVNINNKRLTNVADPVADQDAVNRRFMDSLLLGLNPKQAVRLASNTNHGRVGLIGVDGVTPAEGDRILLKSQSVARPWENGIYIASAGAWSRSDDCDTFDELNRAYCYVLEGNQNAGTSWVQVNVLTNLTTDPVLFLLFSNVTDVLAGDGLVKVGNELSVGAGTGIQVNADDVQIDPAYEGQASITTLGTITTGEWLGSVISSSYGGTGADNHDWTIVLDNANFEVQKVGLAIPEANLVFQVTGTHILGLPTTGMLSTLDGAETFTNKRITKRVQKIASNAQPSIDIDALDAFYITGLSEDITSMTTNLSGTPTDCQELVLWIRDNGSLTPKSIAWGIKFTASTDLPLPTSITGAVWLFLRFVYNSEITKWVMTEKLDNIT